MNNDRRPLVEAMSAYEDLGRLRFHMPGHVGQALIGVTPGLSAETFRFDQTEVEGLDVLSEPSECLKEAQAAAAQAFGVRDSFFLVNGATVGIMAAMLSVLKPGDKVLLPRNVHRAVLNGLILTGAEPVWFYPEAIAEWGIWGAVESDTVKSQLAKHANQIKALILSSPTYEGLGSDIAAIAQLCREAGVFVLVDEAHGSLWSFHPDLPNSATQCDCDFVVNSLHKTGGSLTQSALAHLPKSSKIDTTVFQQALNTLQTTSPSYLLMASLDSARAFLNSESGGQAITFLLKNTHCLRDTLTTQIKQFSLFEPESKMFWDPTRLLLKHPILQATDWAPQIELELKLAYEAVTPYTALYQCGLGLQQLDYRKFLEIFQKAEQQFESVEQAIKPLEWTVTELPKMTLLPREAFFAAGEMLLSENAIGRVAKETVVHCPPGIPILMPGEVILPAHLPMLPQQVMVVR